MAAAWGRVERQRTMPWIESHTLLIGHRKVIELSQALRLRPAYALGHLHALWHAVLEQAEDGDISSWSDELIALKSDVPGSAPQYVRLLHRLRLLDGDLGDNGAKRYLLVHDWLDYAGKFLRGKYSRRRDKLVSIWAKHGKEYGVGADKQPTESRPNADKQPTSWLGTVALERGDDNCSRGENQNGNLSPFGLAWLYRSQKRGGLIVGHEDEDSLVAVFAELIEHGIEPEAIHAEIVSKDRKRFEPIWKMVERLCPKANGKPGLFDSLKAFVQGGTV